MNDKELLELAAKAAGGEIATGLWNGEKLHIYTGENSYTWNPLTDDGDALRLAVKLGLNVEVYRKTPCGQRPGVEVRAFVYRRSVALEQAMDNEDSLQSAARRAIVRAAAYIGKFTP